MIIKYLVPSLCSDGRAFAVFFSKPIFFQTKSEFIASLSVPKDGTLAGSRTR
jgi:hypothetical protein